MTLTRTPQINFEEKARDDPAMLQLLEEWDATLEPAAKNKKTRKDINKYSEKEPGQYRYGRFVITVATNVKVTISKDDAEEE